MQTVTLLAVNIIPLYRKNWKKGEQIYRLEKCLFNVSGVEITSKNYFNNFFYKM